MPALGSQPEWVKSSLSLANGNCVEVASLSGGDVGVRSSLGEDKGVLRFAPDEWSAFTRGVRNGEFERVGRAGAPPPEIGPRPAAGIPGDAVSAEPQDQVYFTRRYAVSQSEESAVVIGMRDYDRLIERLDACKPGSWADLWLAVAGAAAALSVSALVGALTLPPALSGTVDVLWALLAAGAAMTCLCMAGYLTQRRDHGQEIGELKKDLEIRKPGATSAADVRRGWRLLSVEGPRR
jgi:uncharacterized protein DUF397